MRAWGTSVCVCVFERCCTAAPLKPFNFVSCESLTACLINSVDYIEGVSSLANPLLTLVRLVWASLDEQQTTVEVEKVAGTEVAVGPDWLRDSWSRLVERPVGGGVKGWRYSEAEA